MALAIVLSTVLMAFTLLSEPVSATLGVDVSQPVSSSAWSCLKSSGYSFGVVRCYQSTGNVDPNAVATIKNAWAGGMAHVDAYIFPCYQCGNPAGQVTAAVNNLKNNGAPFGMLWLDIEGTQYWSSSTSSNIAFISSMINQAKALGINLGVYTSNSQWSPITGGWTGASALPLWYAHYDSNPSFSDFSAFGGWNTPAIKQYVGDASVCGAGIDKNWYP